MPAVMLVARWVAAAAVALLVAGDLVADLGVTMGLVADLEVRGALAVERVKSCSARSRP